MVIQEPIRGYQNCMQSSIDIIYVSIIGSWWFSSLLLQSLLGVNLALELPCLGVEQRLRDSTLLSHGL